MPPRSKCALKKFSEPDVAIADDAEISSARVAAAETRRIVVWRNSHALGTGSDPVSRAARLREPRAGSDPVKKA